MIAAFNYLIYIGFSCSVSLLIILQLDRLLVERYCTVRTNTCTVLCCAALVLSRNWSSWLGLSNEWWKGSAALLLSVSLSSLLCSTLSYCTETLTSFVFLTSCCYMTFLPKTDSVPVVCSCSVTIWCSHLYSDTKLHC